MTTHIPNHGEQMVRYYGFYSNVSQGLRKKENQDAMILLPSMELLTEPPHILVGRFVEFNL